MKTCHLSPVLNGFSVNAMELDYPMNPNAEVQILGSINGLICISTFSHGTFLWNPSTRISKKLPDSGIKLMSGTDERSSTVYGFGYDASTDDYKVVEILCNIVGLDKYGTEVMVYSSRTGFWTRIGEFSPVRGLDWDSVFVNGAIHWVASVTKDSCLVSLDVANETWGEIALPSDRRRFSVGFLRDGYFSVGVLRECLCVMHYFVKACTDLWIMKEYGVRESWTKLTSIPYMSEMVSEPEPLYLSKKGKILLGYAPRIVLYEYDPQRQSLKDPDIHNFDECYKSTTYVESLVSPMMMIQEGLERQQ